MDEGTVALALAIGARVRQERQSWRWALDGLAGSADSGSGGRNQRRWSMNGHREVPVWRALRNQTSAA
ncbi:MAG TPA: hypothetical protein VF060_03545 [Trebonia sp.]